MRVEFLVLHIRTAAAHVHGEELQAALGDLGARRLVLGNDDDGGRTDRHAWILVWRALQAARDHQTNVDAVAHLVRGEAGEEALHQLRRSQPDVDAQRVRAFVEAVEVLVEERDAAVDDAQALPHAVSEHEACIQHRDCRLGARHQLSVDRDQYVRVARIVDVGVGRGAGGLLGHSFDPL